MFSWLDRLGSYIIRRVNDIGFAFLFLVEIVFSRIVWKKFFPTFLKQSYSIGFLSLPIVLVSGVFIGLVLAVQGYYILSMFASENSVGQLVALALLRELSPVIVALLLAGRVGSSLTAEIGLMKNTEQLDSLEMLGINPINRVVTPRFWATIVSTPLLSLVFSAVGIISAYLMSINVLGIYGGAYWSMMVDIVEIKDIIDSTVKAFVFAIIVAWVSLYQGFYTTATVDGVSSSTTRGVVYSSLAILFADFILTSLLILD